MGFLKRTTLSATVLISALSLAQESPSADWAETTDANGTTIIRHRIRGDFIMHNRPVESQGDLRTEAAKIASVFSQNVPGCRGLGDQFTPFRGAVGIQSVAGECRIIIMQGRGKTVIVFSIVKVDRPSTHAKMDQLAYGLATRDLGPSAPPSPVRTTSNDSPPPIGDVFARLKAASASIPLGNRPIAAVSHASSGYQSYEVSLWLIFPGGMATTCSDWNPTQFQPIPASVGKLDYCDVYAWRRRAGSYEFQYNDGTWGSSNIGEGVFGFKPGERVDLAFGNVRSFGTNFGPSGISAGTISGGDLRLTIAGQIAVGGWSTTNISGPNIGGGSARQSTKLIGHYYLNGFTITTIDARGTIRHGFIGAVGDGAKRIGHIYLNGTHFWDRSD